MNLQNPRPALCKTLSMASGLVFALLFFHTASAQTFVGPFVPASGWWTGPTGNSLGVFEDGSQQTLFFDTDGDGLVGGLGDHSHPYPAALRTGLSVYNYRLSPSREVLYVFGSPTQSCAPGLAETKIYLYRIPPTDGAALQPLVVGECIPEGIAFEGFFDGGPGAQQVYFAVGRANATSLLQDIFWADLQTGASGWTNPGFSQDVVAVSFDPNGYAALVQHDAEATNNLADYRLIGLCADAIGSGYSAVPGALGQIAPPVVSAEVVDNAGVADIRVTQSGSTLLQTPLVDCAAVSVDLGACCFPDGSCADGLAQSACESVTNGGTWQGLGSTCASVQCPQPPAPALTLVGSAPANVTAQQNFPVNVTWSNAGTGPATNVAVTFTVPSTLNFVSATAGGSYNSFSRRVTWTVGTLAAGASGNAQVTLNASCGVTGASYSGFFLTSTEQPLVFGNSMSTSVSQPATGPIQVTIQSTADAGEPVPNGGTITHRFDLTNPTSDAMPLVDFSVNLGAYQELDAVVDAGTGAATLQNSSLTWSGSLPAFGQTSVIVRMKMSDCRPASVTETQMSNGADIFFRGACGATLATAPPSGPIQLAPPAISAVVSATNLQQATGSFYANRTAPYLARPGAAIDFEYTLVNSYASPQLGLTATVTLPPSLLPAGNPPFVGTPPVGTSWDAGTNTITWTGDLPASSSIVIRWSASLDPSETCTANISSLVSTSACPFLASGIASVLIVPDAYAGPHLVTLTPFEGLYRFRPGVDSVAQPWFCYNFEIFFGMTEGAGGDLWMVGYPIARLNPDRLEFEVIEGDLYQRLGVSNIYDVAVDRISGVVYFAGAEGLGSPSREYLRVRSWNPVTDAIGVLFDDTPVPNPTYGRPRSLVLDGDGQLAVVVGSGVLRIDPAAPGTGSFYSIAEFTSGTAASIALDAAGDYLLAESSWISTGPKALVRMDRSTGTTTAVVSNLVALGATPSQPYTSAAFDGTDQLYLLTDSGAFGTQVDIGGSPTSSAAFFGHSSNSDLVWYSGASGSTAAPELPAALPERLRFTSVQPNPFNPRTTLSFELPQTAPVRLSVHDIRGREVRVLLNEVFTAGRHEVVWNGQDSSRRAVASGVYFARLDSVGDRQVTKMVLVR